MRYLSIISMIALCGCQSNEQNLIFECERLVTERMVAPATTKFVDRKVQLPGVQSKRLAAADSEITKQKSAITELQKNCSDARTMLEGGSRKGNKAIDSGRVDVALEILHASADLATATVKLEKIVDDRSQSLSELISQRNRLAEDGRGEIQLRFDSQNRMGAFLRHNAVCSFTNASRDIKSVTLDMLEE